MNLRAAYAQDRCWDAQTQAIFEARGEALDDCILQNREELLGLAAFIEAEQIRSYLEIGVWTGRLVSALHRVHRFDLVAAADQGWAERCGFQIRLPPDARVFRGDSDSAEFLAWRAGLGHVDLVFIDANHSYRAVRRDVEINLCFPHRFLALHDISGAHRATTGVAKAWRELRGDKREIWLPHPEAGRAEQSLSQMGIGLLASAPTPLV